MRASGIVTAALVMGVILTGCQAVAQPENDDNFGFEASPEVRDSLADSHVSSDEYELAFRRYEACLATEGYELLIEDDGTTPVIEYSVPAAAVDTGVDDVCYYENFYLVDTAWQVQSE